MQPSNVQTFKLGLIGYPLSHSLSPQIHGAALNACGLEGGYSLFPIPPGDRQGLKDILSRLRTGDLHGINVTIPHKQTVIDFLDELTPTAKAIGAVNTIYMKDSKLVGENTDAAGFLSDLRKFLPESPSTFRAEQSDSEDEAGRGAGVREKSAIVLGAGGSARAIVYALLHEGWNVTLAARRLQQARGLAPSFPGIKVVELNVSTFKRSNVHLIVNTTPLGMTPDVDGSPLPENLSLPSNVFIYDLVYNPMETRLVRDARAQGLKATTGLGMLIEQAALSFELWTGHNPRRDNLIAALEIQPVSNL